MIFFTYYNFLGISIYGNNAIVLYMDQSFVNIIQNFHSHIFDAERLPVAIVAVIMVLFVGMFKSPPGGLTTPIMWHLIDKLFGNLGAKMDKPDRLPGDLIFRGFLLTVMVVCIFFLFGRYADGFTSQISYYRLPDALLLTLCMASGSSIFALAQLYKALNKKSVDKHSYYRIARSTRTNLAKADDFTITRVGMTMMVRTFDKGIVAPVLWYLIFGLAGAFIYTALAGLSWRFGRDGKGYIGQAAMGMERLMGFIPNVLAGFFISIGALFTPTAGLMTAFRGWFSAKGQAKYEEGGFPVTAAAWGLKVSLGGPTQDIDGHVIKRAWAGPEKATAQLAALHLHRAIYITFISHILFIAALSGAMIFGQTDLFGGIFTNIGNIGASALDFIR